jgi:hypothetical protein
MATSTTRARRGDRYLLWVGVAVLVTSLLLYVAGAALIVAGWAVPLALAVAVVGWWGTRGHVIPRWVYVALAVAAVAVVIAGAVTVLYAIAHAPAGSFASA